MGLLATLCLLLGVLPTTMIEAMAPITQLLVRQALPSAAAQGWLWLTPISPQVASYSAPFVVAAIVVVFGLGYLFLKRGAVPARRAYAWDCGFGQLNAPHAVHLDRLQPADPARFRRRMEGRGAHRHARQRGARFRG